MAEEWPILPAPRPASRRVEKLPHGTANLRDAHRPEYSHRARSRAAILVDQIAQALPWCFAKFPLPPPILDARPPQLEPHPDIRLGEHAMEPAFHQCPGSDPFSRRELAHV